MNNDYDDMDDSAGYADSLTGFGFFAVTLGFCAALVGIVLLAVRSW